ncbi:MAG: hypothetical protein JWR64_1456, partial [Marmoricola sp.]|nr:hypothetical protein [Marmoricola sp.]
PPADPRPDPAARRSRRPRRSPADLTPGRVSLVLGVLGVVSILVVAVALVLRLSGALDSTLSVGS